MIARILYVPDFHKRWKDSESVKGLIELQLKQQAELIQYITESNITHVILGGDWYDRGFHGLGPAFGQFEMDRRLSKSVNGNVYLCVGNHFYLERDENPEMYVIQPNELIPTGIKIPLPETPIFKCVRQLMLGTVQIDFFHFSKTNKEYYCARNPETTFHIGVYHDDVVCPAYVREMEGYHSTIPQNYYDKVLHNIDLALCGHMHSKIGLTRITLMSGRTVPMYIPGVMHATKNVDHEKHVEVELPVIQINDDSTITFEKAKFSTHLDELRFYGGKKATKKKDAPIEATVNNYINSINNAGATRSLGTYLQSIGYSPTRMKIVESAMRGDLSFNRAVNIVSAAQKGEAL